MRHASRSGHRAPLDPLRTEAPARQPADMKRRGFLLSLGAGSAGAAALVVGASVGAVDSAVTEASDRSDARGYQVTEHVRNYYRTTKL